VFEGTNRLQAGISNTNMLRPKKQETIREMVVQFTRHADAAPKTQAQNLAGNLARPRERSSPDIERGQEDLN